MRSLLARKAASGIGWPEAWSKRKGNAQSNGEATGINPKRLGTRGVAEAGAGHTSSKMDLSPRLYWQGRE
jgi:hypothetical protein